MTAEVITHELIHAYDDARAIYDYENPEHVACSEIRASNLSGECKFFREAQRTMVTKSIFSLPYVKHQPVCVRRRALLSMKLREFDDEVAEKAVNKVWNTCYNDIEPFKRAI